MTVIVAGSGAAGLVAALAAATAGADVLVLERSDLLGGTTALGGGRVWVVPPGYLPMTHAEWERWRYPSRFDRDLLSTRLAAGIRTNGVALAASLVDGVIRAGARIETGARLVDVLTRPRDAGTEAGKPVTHAVIERAVDGHGTERVPASAVILGCGGFDWDETFRGAWHPAAQRATGAAPGNTGDALRIAGRLGAATDNLGEGWWMPMIAVPGEAVDGVPYPRSLIRERALPRQIMVNAAGRRFVDEAAPYNEVGKAMHRSDPSGCPNDPAFLVFDAGFTRKYALPGFQDAQVPGWMPRAASLTGLAETIGVDPAGLTATVARWNEACAGGTDPDFGRGGNVYDRYGGDPDGPGAPNLGPLTDPPFYAVRVLAGTIGTKGGPVTDAAGTVLTTAGTPIPGLYAVGNAAAFWTGEAYPAPGATLGIAMTMAYIAGRHAASRASALTAFTA